MKSTQFYFLCGILYVSAYSQTGLTSQRQNASKLLNYTLYSLTFSCHIGADLKEAGDQRGGWHTT